MSRILPDEEIAELLAEKKVLRKNWEKKVEPRRRQGQQYARRSLRVQGERGHSFRIDVRDNPRSLFDFSVILTLIDSDDEEYILTRFNGKHAHTNKWERKHNQPHLKIRNAFHIHRATERYQTDPECQIDGYAELTNTYYSFSSALRAFVTANGCEIEREIAKGQKSLFDDQE